MKYKVGDKVKIKSLDWYNKNKGNADKTNSVWCEDDGAWFFYHMSQNCGKIMTIKNVWANSYTLEGSDSRWTDEMIEGLVERNGETYPYKIGDRVILMGGNRCATITDLKYNSQGKLSYYIKIDNDKDISIDYPTELLLPYDNMVECKVEEETSIDLTVKGEDVNERIEIAIPEGYEYAIESGKIIFNKKKKEYPKTFEECVSVLMCKGGNRMPLELMNTFRKLIDARNAYWTIYGKENGLGKPWEPTMETVYCISRNENVMKCSYRGGKSNVLEFPTEEMRDTFYENFKTEIESCKEFL